jgi:3-methyladenine DNA glycosylase AlkD
MPVRRTRRSSRARAATTNARGGPSSVDEQVQQALTALERASTKRDYENLARFGIATSKAFGVSMANIQRLAKRLGRSHELAEALWATGWYEARLLTAFVDEPERVTSAQMDRWCRDFDNWGICDTVCFKLFDQTPHAWAKVDAWADKRNEFEKRAAFALLASLAGHDKMATDQMFIARLPLVERAASDDRNFVKKGVNWALRRVGGRSPALRAAAVKVAKRLAVSPKPAARWVGKNALNELAKRGRAL